MPQAIQKRETSRPRREGPVCVSKWEVFPVLDSLLVVLEQMGGTSTDVKAHRLFGVSKWEAFPVLNSLYDILCKMEKE